MQPKPKIYTVSQLNSIIKGILEDNLSGLLTVTGQISDWKVPQSGHCYFSLKDENSVLPCVMWKSKFSRVKFEPENGLAVIANGNIDVYSPQGKYQFYVESMQPAGVGALQLAFEQMVRKLTAEGLFDDAHKKPLPAYPQRIAIITSESGAAVRDIADSIRSRWPCVKLLLYPVPVQGEGAAAEIAAALKDVNKRNNRLRLDLIILGRGGGSMEDLWAFNEEVLARAIFDSSIPIINAVGHEIDTTIADLVADARASTPTKAGVTAVPDMNEVLRQLAGIEGRLADNINARVELAHQNLQTVLASAVFRNPLLPVRDREQQLDEISAKLAVSVRQLLADAKVRLHAAFQWVIKIEPHRFLGKRQLELSELRSRALAAAGAVLERSRLGLTAQANRLAALDPKSVLKRGYSITTDKKTGLLIRKAQDVRIDDLLITELAERNFIESKVMKKQNKGK